MSLHLSLLSLFVLHSLYLTHEHDFCRVEALQLYESIRSSKSGVKPNFVTLNSLLIALDKADQQALAETIYREALQDKILSPWKRRFDNDDCKMKTMMVSFAAILCFHPLYNNLTPRDFV